MQGGEQGVGEIYTAKNMRNYFNNLLCKMYYTQKESNSNNICVILMHKLNLDFFYRPKISNPKYKSKFE